MHEKPEKTLKCEILMKPGTKWEEPCGEPAGTYRCTGSIGFIVLDLCDAHHIKLIADNGWMVEKIEDREATPSSGGVTCLNR